ncbi:MAG: carboxypeptidase-like regulatory domain-containing protein, partial [Flavisolibacter sp.]|nr:carboxypeptidase-like regulatory domain-containing protein [Flavisolibacter sp.]
MNQRPGFLLTIFTLFIAGIAFGQTKIIVGYARDEHSLDPVPFASARFRVSGNGALADSSGRFWLYLPNANDTLEVTSVGYQDFILPIHPSSVSGDTLHINANMVPGKITTGVVIKAKVNRALILWKRIVAHKPQNDRYRFNNFSYEIYNKLELDLKNIN